MIKYLLLFSMALGAGFGSYAQQVQIGRDELIALTPEWKGERFPDGRPKVPDDIIRRMKLVSIEEAWATLVNAGYRYQVADGWQVINPDSVLVGRAVTTTFMPGRPDVWKVIDSVGKKEGRRAQNVWAVEMLVKGDVYVADQFGAKRNGPTIGDNVGNAIYARTGNGIVYDGAIRDPGRPERDRRVHFFLYKLRPVLSQSGSGAEQGSDYDDHRDQSPYPYKNGDSNARRCGLGKSGSRDLYSSSVGGKSGEDLGDHSSTRPVRSPASAGGEILGRAN